MPTTIRCILTLSLALLCAPLQAQPELVFGINKSLSMPLAQIYQSEQQATAEQGLLVKLSEQLAEHLQYRAVNRVISRGDLSSSLMNGSVDIVCYITPEWLHIPHGSVSWSATILKTRDILVSRHQQATLKTTDDLRGKTLGTVRHYSYPFIQKMLDSGEINSFSASSEHANFMQLFRNDDVDAIIFKELTFDYLYQHYHHKDRFPITKHPLVIEFIEPRCAISKSSPVDNALFDEALHRLKQDNFIENYLKNIQR